MIIHSVTPIQYLLPQDALPPTATMNIAGGILEGTPGPEGFAIRRIIATDPSVYLRPELMPGQNYQNPQSPTGGELP